MRNKKQRFVEHITQHILELVELTYRVSYHYVSKDPQLSIAYDAKNHTFVVIIQGNKRIISLKQTRLKKSNTLKCFDDVIREIRQTYVLHETGELNTSLLEQTQRVCLKHIDLNRNAHTLESSFTFRADDGVVTSILQDRERYVWWGVMQHRGTDMDYITVVDAHHNRYPHLSEEVSQQYVEGYIYGQLHRLNGLLDINLQMAHSEQRTYSDVSLLKCMDMQRYRAGALKT